MRASGWIWVLAALIFFQASDVTLRQASVQTHAAVGTTLQALPLLAVSAVVMLRRRATVRDRIERRSWPLMLAYGALQFFVGNALFYAAMQLGGLSIASPAVQSQAIWAVLIGGLLLRERISRMMMGGIVLFVIGIASLAWFKTAGSEAVTGDWTLAALLGVLGGLAWASGSATQRVLLQRGVPVSYILAVGSLCGVVAMSAFAGVWFGPAIWRDVEAAGVWTTLLAGCFNGLAIYSISQAVRTIAISKVIPVISLNIVFNTLTGAIGFGEYVNAGSVVSMLVTFVAVVLVQEPKLPGQSRRAPADVNVTNRK